MPETKRIVVLISFSIVVFILGTALWQKLSRSSAHNFVIVTPTHITLATDNATIRNSVTISNPSERPIYDAELRIALNPIGISSDSILIESDAEPPSQNKFNDIPLNTLRINASSSGKNNKHPDIIYFRLGFIPAKSDRELRISGSLKTNSWADLSVSDYKTNLAISDWNPKLVINEIYSVGSAMWKDTKGAEIQFPLTNLPFGGIYFTNGKPAFTNLPHLMLSLDTPDFGGTNQFNLTNDFIFLTNNQFSFPRTAALLFVPEDEPTLNPRLKLWLVNDSGVSVTNIEVLFTSMSGFNFQTNEFYSLGAASANAVINPVIFHLDLLPVAQAIKIPPISLRSPNYNSPGLIGICINATNMPSQYLNVFLAFVTTNVASKPLVLKASASVAAVSNNNTLFFIRATATIGPAVESKTQAGKSDASEVIPLVIIVAIVALVVISVTVYAIRE